MSLQQAAKTSFRQINGVVVSAGLMAKTVKVRVGRQKWDNHIKKYWKYNKNLMVHDPRSSLRIGDVVAISPGWRVSKQIRHVVTSIIAPFGDRIEDRPPVPTEEERLAARAEKRAAKDERRARRKSGVKDVEKVKDTVKEVREQEGTVDGVASPRMEEDQSDKNI